MKDVDRMVSRSMRKLCLRITMLSELELAMYVDGQADHV